MRSTIIGIFLAMFSFLSGLAQDIDRAKSDNPKFIAAGTSYSVFIKNGLLFSTGQNSYGQLGITSKNNVSSPTQIGTATNYVSVASCSYTTLCYITKLLADSLVLS